MPEVDTSTWDAALRLELLGAYIARGLQVTQQTGGQIPDGEPNPGLLFTQIIEAMGDSLDGELAKIVPAYEQALTQSVAEHKAEAERQAEMVGKLAAPKPNRATRRKAAKKR